jgi:hypothetical protein
MVLLTLWFLQPSFPTYQMTAQASLTAKEPQYTAEPLLGWSAADHKASFGVRLSAQNIPEVQYYGEVWVQLYYEDQPGSKTSRQLLYNANVSVTQFAELVWPNLRNLTWQKNYVFTQWNDGKHDLTVNLNWVDNMNLTNWCTVEGSPMAPFSVWNGSMCLHHLDWTETVDFTVHVAPPPPSDLPATLIGGFFLVLAIGAVSVKGISGLKKLSKKRRR